ncbi:ABC transporter substrate-binding protein [Bosea sp. (in: a-proteobacteria)]|uniref:ABC transporter substrate-binding protein n=1 Tax=Bosea sp. (in: a-proteobacteria) TaxID=1871050 RepID=UPI00261302E2|nr:ABC transporter substrate-binding protein [Bosea sp. (in: a-proteobacteria)]MCO5089474.1 ABC transporter substrate-binding protein [Bosea sp. (in: a-proteobacteria)]
MISRRNVVIGGASATTMIAMPYVARAAQSVVFCGVGGSAAETYKKNIFPKFEKAFGIKVQYIPATIMEGLSKLEAQRASPQMDIVMVTEEGYAQYRQKGLFEHITADILPAITDIYPVLRYPGDDGVPIQAVTTGIAYNSKIFESKGLKLPTSVQDLWRPDLKGRVAIWPPATTTGVLMLLMIAKVEGGSPTNIMPAFERLKKFKNDVYFNIADEMTLLFQQETIWLGWWNNVRASLVADTGFPVSFITPVEGAPLFTNGTTLVKGAPNRENAIKLMNWLLSQDGQELIAQYYYGGPVAQSVKLDPELAKKVAYGKTIMDGAYMADMSAVVSERSKWIDLWAREIAR